VASDKRKLLLSQGCLSVANVSSRDRLLLCDKAEFISGNGQLWSSTELYLFCLLNKYLKFQVHLFIYCAGTSDVKLITCVGKYFLLCTAQVDDTMI